MHGEAAVKSGTHTKSKERILSSSVRRHRDGRWQDENLPEQTAKTRTHHVHRRAEQRDRDHRGEQRRVKVCMATPRGGAVCAPMWHEGPPKRHDGGD